MRNGQRGQQTSRRRRRWLLVKGLVKIFTEFSGGRRHHVQRGSEPESRRTVPEQWVDVIDRQVLFFLKKARKTKAIRWHGLVFFLGRGSLCLVRRGVSALSAVSHGRASPRHWTSPYRRSGRLDIDRRHLGVAPAPTDATTGTARSRPTAGTPLCPGRVPTLRHPIGQGRNPVKPSKSR